MVSLSFGKSSSTRGDDAITDSEQCLELAKQLKRSESTIHGNFHTSTKKLMANVHQNKLALKFLMWTTLVFVLVGKLQMKRKNNLMRIKKIPNKIF